MTDKGIRMGGTQKQGVVYWCENNANATELVKALNTIGANAKMHVAYVDSDGGVVWRR